MSDDSRFFHAKRRSTIGGGSVCICEPGWPSYPLPNRRNLRDHSPDGFQWGYGGSGPAQLALAMVAEATGDDALALRTYQRFKEAVLAPEKRNEWTLHLAEVAALAAQIDAALERARSPSPNGAGQSAS